MSRLGVWMLLAANRILPRPALPDPSDTTDMVAWQYRTSDLLLDLWEEVGGDPPVRVLDLGSGRGGKSRRLAEASQGAYEVVALDISLSHLKRAAAHFHEAGWELPVMVGGDAMRLPFADGSFQRIACTDLLEHVPHPRAMLREIRRCLTPEGRLVLVFNPWGSPRGSHLGNLIRFPWCQHFFARDTLEAATVAAARAEARRLSPAQALAMERWGHDLAAFFREHVHPTRIRDLRRWLRDEALFTVEREVNSGPLGLGGKRWLRTPGIEEWLTQSYGVVLRPRV
jgi:SAM-dependent methyltransferase